MSNTEKNTIIPLPKDYKESLRNLKPFIPEGTTVESVRFANRRQSSNSEWCFCDIIDVATGKVVPNCKGVLVANNTLAWYAEHQNKIDAVKKSNKIEGYHFDYTKIVGKLVDSRFEEVQA